MEFLCLHQEVHTPPTPTHLFSTHFFCLSFFFKGWEGQKAYRNMGGAIQLGSCVGSVLFFILTTATGERGEGKEGGRGD